MQCTGTVKEKVIEIGERTTEKEAGESGEWKSGIAGGWAHTVWFAAHCDECSTRPDPPLAYIFFLFWFFSILLRRYKALFPVLDISNLFFFEREKGLAVLSFKSGSVSDPH